jgi:K+-sensing histidine kinase KdpD
VLAAAASVAVVSGAVALLEPYVPVLSLGALYALAVLPIAIAYGLAYAVPVAIASMLAFNFFFLEPRHTFSLADSRNWLALAVFVVTAVVVSELAARSRRRARESALLAAIATSLLEQGGLGEELDRIASEAAGALRVERVWIELEPPGRASAGGYPLEVGTRQVGTIHLEGRRQGSEAARRRLLPAP